MKLLYRSKYINKNNSIVKMLMPSLLGIMVCIICLMGTTWSWFTATVSTPMQSIKAANYSITVDIKDGDDTIALVDGKYSLSQKTEGKGYEITVKANGTVTTGYFKLAGPDGFYSMELKPESKITFTFYPSTEGQYEFISSWGSNTGGNIINKPVIGTPKQSEEHIDDTGELEDTEISKDTVDSTSVSKTNKEENLDKESDEITSTNQPMEEHEGTEGTATPNTSNGDSDLEESVEETTIEPTEETSSNTEQTQE